MAPQKLSARAESERQDCARKIVTAILYEYWRSTAAYRTRIALNLKGIAFESVPVNLLAGEQRAEAHRRRNPQGLVPALEIDGRLLTQSLAIAEYLDETRPSPPLLPADPAGRQRVRAIAYAIAMEIHPVCNLRVVRHLATLTEKDPTAGWMQHFIRSGLEAVEAMLVGPETGRCCHGDTPGLADLCLLPQLYNADRWQVPVGHLATIGRIASELTIVPAFAAAHPDCSKPASA